MDTRIGTRIRKNIREEIIVDDVPIGNVLLDDDGKAHWAIVILSILITRQNY